MKQVLFIQGAGEGAFDEDAKLAASLQGVLGDEYHVVYPKMPNEENPDDAAWMTQIAEELASLDDNVILVGHSAGGAVLLKYLLKRNLEKPVAGIFLISIHTGVRKMRKGRNIHFVKVSPPNSRMGCRFSFTIAATTNGCRLHIWDSTQKKFHKPSSVNSMGVDISSTITCLKLQRI